MHVSFHLGAHRTDEDQLIKSLLKNGGRLAQEGVAVPGPGRYRSLVSDVVSKLGGKRASQDTQDLLIETLVDMDDADRLVLGHENFFGAPHRALEHGQLYPLAERNSTWLRNMFPDLRVSFFMGMRNPATFVPAVLSGLSDEQRNAIMTQLDPRALFWSDTIHAIRDANPDCSVTVWCNEDTPLIWPEIMHEICGLDATTQLKGGFDILGQIMQPEGMQRMRAYLASHPLQNEIQRRRVIAAFLERFAIEDEIEEEIDLPGWTEELVEELCAAYDDDMLEIKRIPGVTLLTA
ncbi:hypothetical protein [Aliiroseovarius marinus]|uniref:hypothetical protein n=1 Tax=Aliiroseovarius marinus TaxID=2500159 RepID=UPI003D7EC4C6